MVNSVSPNYYADGETTEDYILSGSGFLDIPLDAKGILAYDNEQPLQHISSDDPIRLFSVRYKTNYQIILSPDVLIVHNANTYLGAIVSNDRQTIYWVNNSNPLP